MFHHFTNFVPSYYFIQTSIKKKKKTSLKGGIKCIIYNSLYKNTPIKQTKWFTCTLYSIIYFLPKDYLCSVENNKKRIPGKLWSLYSRVLSRKFLVLVMIYCHAGWSLKEIWNGFLKIFFILFKFEWTPFKLTVNYTEARC